MENSQERVGNPFDLLLKKVEELSAQNQRIEQMLTDHLKGREILFTEFLREYGITRPTGKAWAKKELIRLEKRGGTYYVPVDSIKVGKKYQRK